MRRRAGAFAVVLAAALLPGAGAVPAGANVPMAVSAAVHGAGAAAASPTPLPDPDTLRNTADDYVAAGGRIVPGGADARPSWIRKWRGKRIRYHEKIPKKWDWGLTKAVKAWNRSGGKIKFVKVSSPRRAQVRIRYGDTGGADGMATLGRTPGAWVRLSNTYKRVTPDATNTVWVGRLFAHELGHVLGFEHTGGQCSLMVPVFDMGACPLLDEEPGYYACRWINGPLVKKFVKMYGGRKRMAPRRCLIDPLAPRLGNVAFRGGHAAGGPVTVTWSNPVALPEGARVRVRVWRAGVCGAAPQLADEFWAPTSARRWSDPRKAAGNHCYQVAPTNRWGAARPPLARLVDRWWPAPAKPTVGPPEWVPSSGLFRATASAPAGTTLYAATDWDDPGTCVDRWPGFGSASTLQRDGAGRVLLHPAAATTCVTIFAVAEWGAVSAPVGRVLQVPTPEPPGVGLVTAVDEWGTFSATVTYPSTLWVVGRVTAGACPAQPPTDQWWNETWEDAGTLMFWAAAEGANCLQVATEDPWEQRSDIVMRPFSWTSPDP